MTTATPANYVAINWRVQGDLRKTMRKFGPEALADFLRRAGDTIANDARGNLMAKGWKRLGHAMRESINWQVNGSTLEVGSTHVAAAMREYGGRISAPGRGPRSRHRKMLTIPIRGSPAYGKSVDDMEAAGWIIFRPKGTRVLMGVRQGARSTKKNPTRGQAVALFALAKSVPHPASPWFPTFAQITARLNEAAAKAMAQ